MIDIRFPAENKHKISPFQKKYDNLENHYAIHHPLFIFLEKQTGSLNSLQFQAIRDNYIYRTLNTIPCIAHALIAAVKNLDYYAIALIGKNLSEETGEGIAAHAHIFLLLFSFSEHGQKIFNIPPIHPAQLDRSPFILQSAKSFAIKQKALYQSSTYPLVVGASMGQELAAEPMLQSLYQTIFEPYESLYTSSDYLKISQYFDCHLNGTEKQHALDTYEIADRLVKESTENESLIIEGATRFLKLQADLWDELLELLKKLTQNSLT